MIETDVLSNHNIDPKFYENKKCYCEKACNYTEDEKSTETIFQINTQSSIVVGEKVTLRPTVSGNSITLNIYGM